LLATGHGQFKPLDLSLLQTLQFRPLARELFFESHDERVATMHQSKSSG